MMKRHLSTYLDRKAVQQPRASFRNENAPIKSNRAATSIGRRAECLMLKLTF